MNRLGRAPHWRWAAPLVLALVAGCAAPASEARSLVLHTLNGSGVSGTVTLTGVDASRTLVEVEVDKGNSRAVPFIGEGTASSRHGPRMGGMCREGLCVVLDGRCER